MENRKTTRPLLSIIDAEQENEATFISLTEFCRLMHADHDLVVQLVENELIHPTGDDPYSWQFDAICIQRARTALSFYHSLEVNLPGLALALDLLDQIAELKTEVNRLRKFTE